MCGGERDQEHMWGGCVCDRCHRQRDDHHDWDGCVCRTCGLKSDRGHTWNGCICPKCHGVRDLNHQWVACVCLGCGNMQHVWQNKGARTSRNHGLRWTSEEMFYIFRCAECGEELDSGENKMRPATFRCGQHDWLLVSKRDNSSVSPGSYYDTHRLHTNSKTASFLCTKCGRMQPTTDSSQYDD